MRRLVTAVAALVAAAGITRCRHRDHERRPRRERPSGGRRAPRAEAFSDGTWEDCTGTLISPTVFLTAAHCDEGVEPRRRHLRHELRSPTGTTYWGTWHADPDLQQGAERPARHRRRRPRQAGQGITPALLPERGSLAACRRPAVHLGRLRRPVGHEGPGGRPSTTPTSATSRPAR